MRKNYLYLSTLLYQNQPEIYLMIEKLIVYLIAQIFNITFYN